MPLLGLLELTGVDDEATGLLDWTGLLDDCTGLLEELLEEDDEATGLEDCSGLGWAGTSLVVGSVDWVGSWDVLSDTPILDEDEETALEEEEDDEAALEEDDTEDALLVEISEEEEEDTELLLFTSPPFSSLGVQPDSTAAESANAINMGAFAFLFTFFTTFH